MISRTFKNIKEVTAFLKELLLTPKTLSHLEMKEDNGKFMLFYSVKENK